MAKTGAISVWGPYKDGPTKYRLKISESGHEKNLCFKTRESAEEVRIALLARNGDSTTRTVGDAIEDFSQTLANGRGLKTESVTWAKEQLTGWLPLTRSMALIGEREAVALYESMVSAVSCKTGKPVAVATQQSRLQMARRLWTFAVKAGYCRTNPWSAVVPIGRKASGKPQLRIDEARRFASFALRAAESGDTYALGALLMMYLGLRQGEVIARVARDIDDEGRVLWVPFGKNQNARRRLNVPEAVRPLLRNLAESRPPGELLFYQGSGVPHRAYFWVHVKRLCRQAGVPEICPHSLRGLHATLALDGGATADAVAHALGHGSFAMTAKHYASPSSVANSRGSRVAATLSESRDSRLSELAATLNSIPKEDLSELLATLGYKSA